MIVDPSGQEAAPSPQRGSIVFTDCTVKRLPGAATADWMLVEDGRVAALGSGSNRPNAHHVVHLDGATVLPAFCDAHVHLPATGIYASGMDFRGETKKGRIIDDFRRAATDKGLLFGGNFEDPLDEPITRRDLDAAVGDRPALLVRADMHSCVASTTLLDELDVSGLEGVDVDEASVPTGYLRERAAAAAWNRFETSLSSSQQRDAIRRAVSLAYAKGIAEVHEMHVVEWRGWDAFDVLRAAVDDVALQVVPYVASDDVERVRGMGLSRIGGDWFLDGSFGSHTAWLTEPYRGTPPAGTPATGIAYRSDGELFELFLSAQRVHMQVGVHAIGDAAIEQAVATWERVADAEGVASVRALGHRIEHFECASDDHMGRAARLGLRASVQPAFDLLWGGDDGLYARRIGPERARLMNRFETMTSHGLLVGAGSDSTVTPLDPFLAMKALRSHHVDGERSGRTQAIRLNTMGSRLLARRTGPAGVLEPPLAADFVAVDRDPAATDAEELGSIEIIGTWIGGMRVHPEEARERE